MKCSLLTLSTYIDGELPRDAHAEVDAHIVGCSRCATGATTLREEKLRVARLARVHVPADSAQAMLEQVGILVAATPDVPAVRLHRPGDDDAWPAPATAWSTPHAAAIEVEEAGAAAPAVLSTQAAMRAPTSEPWEPDHQPAYVDEAMAHPDRLTTLDASPPAGIAGSLPGQTPQDPRDSWEGRPSLAVDNPVRPPSVPAPVSPAPPPPPPAPPPSFMAPAPAPTRAPANSGAGALWARVRDAAAVRLALSRGAGADDIESGVHVVSGAPVRRPPVTPGAAGARPEQVVATPPASPVSWPEQNGDVPAAGSSTTSDLPAPTLQARPASAEGQPPAPALTHDGIVPAAAAPILADAIDLGTYSRPEAPAPSQPDSVPAADEAAVESDRWNAFAASSYPGVATETSETPSTRPIGRHGRAVARDGKSVGERVLASMAALRLRTRDLANAARSRTAGLSQLNPDSRLWAAVAGVGLIFILALLIGHAASPSGARHPATAARPSAAPPSAAATQPATSAPTPTAAPTPPPAATATTTFGSGATGFTVDGLRYGKTATYTRIVFDLGGPSGAGGTPRITIATETPTTLLVTLYGTAPSSLVGTPPGPLLTSVTLLHGSPTQTTYRLTVSRPTRQVAFFLLTPVRFVLDLH